MTEQTVNKQTNEDRLFDLALRPRNWDEYIGQGKIKENLKIFIDAAKGRKESLEHVLLYGPAGLGKSSLAHIIAREMQSNIRVTSGPAIEKAGDLGSILTNLAEGDILFIDEAHRLNKTIEEILYPAMEDYKLDIIIGKGPSARILELKLPRFTMIAATTRIGLLSGPLRSRFGNTYKLEYYEKPEIKQIIARSAGLLGVEIENEGVEIIASSSRQTPRVANRLLKRARDYAEVRGRGIITGEVAKEALRMLEVDELGLEAMDRKLLDILITKFSGRPVGIKTLAASTAEEEDTIESVYEPYLLQIGFIERTPRGRIATKSAYKHLGIKQGRNEQLI